MEDDSIEIGLGCCLGHSAEVGAIARAEAATWYCRATGLYSASEFAICERAASRSLILREL